MPITILAPDDQTKFDIVDGIIDTVGREITLNYVDGTVLCVTCSGGDPFCLVCSGLANIETLGSETVTARVQWGPSEKKIYTPVGQYVEGDCKITFSVTNKEDTDLLLRKTRTVTVDGRSCVIDKWYYKGQPINRVYLILNEDEDLEGYRIG